MSLIKTISEQNTKTLEGRHRVPHVLKFVENIAMPSNCTPAASTVANAKPSTRGLQIRINIF